MEVKVCFPFFSIRNVVHVVVDEFASARSCVLRSNRSAKTSLAEFLCQCLIYLQGIVEFQYLSIQGFQKPEQTNCFCILTTIRHFSGFSAI